MKVNKEQFRQAIGLLASINFENLDELDLSEFYDINSKEFKDNIEDWKFMELSNVEFLKHYDWDNKE